MQFKNLVSFKKTTFNNSANFNGTNFNDLADFTRAIFNNIIFFTNSSFNNYTLFNYASFKNSAYFKHANFTNYANFDGADFIDSAKFSGPEKPDDKIILDGKNVHIFNNYYDHVGLHGYADDLSYNYRKAELDKNGTSFDSDFLWNYLSWLTGGFGVRPFHTIICAFFLIVIFSLIYANPRLKRSNSIIFFRLSSENPGIVRDKDQKASPIDLFYYSICTFTFLSPEDLRHRDNFRPLVALEGIIGYILLIIMVGALSHVMRISR